MVPRPILPSKNACGRKGNPSTEPSDFRVLDIHRSIMAGGVIIKDTHDKRMTGIGVKWLPSCQPFHAADRLPYYSFFYSLLHMLS